MAYGEYVRNDSVSVGTSSVLIAPARKRSEITLTNTSTGAQNITLAFGNPAVAGAGVFLVPYAVYFANNNQGFLTWEGEIYAISSGVGGTLAVFER